MSTTETPAEIAEREQAEQRYEDALSKHLREKHLGDPAYDKLFSPGAIRRQEERDREEDDRYGY